MHAALWAPWRLAYLHGLERKATGHPAAESRHDSFLAAAWSEPRRDRDNHVVLRDPHGIVLLNRYPYANGHLLVALGEARPTLLDYPAEARSRFWALLERAASLCRAALEPHGLNIGINEGAAAGAGVPGHLHAHVVPRWTGDTNFMSVVGDVRVIPDGLESMADRYRAVARSLES